MDEKMEYIDNILSSILYQTAKNVEKLINEDYELFLKLIEGKE